MGISVEWGNQEKTILVGVVEWPYAWQELRTAWNTTVAMLRDVPQSVHLIVVARSSRFPTNDILANLKLATQELPNNLGLAILVTDNAFLQVINRIFFQITPGFRHRGYVVRSLEAAYTLIAEQSAEAGS